MLFNSYSFLFLFLPIVLMVWLKVRTASNAAWPVGWLVVASLVYYGCWKPKFLLLLLFSVLVNLVFGKLLITGGFSRLRSRWVLAGGVVFNLCLLGYFKYAGFLVVNFNSLFGAGIPVPDIVLPIGISFITFQKIAFLVDAHRGEVKNFSLLNYALFVTFFPQLIAGPIVHHAELLPQLDGSRKRDARSDVAIGISIFIVGLFKKVIVADALAVYANAGFEMVKAGDPIGAASAWIAVISFSLQLYYDFSGYSDMAVGLGRMFGIILPVNFNSPYKATSIIDFWRRWHMSLSRFLRDYLYIPLGGGRCGTVRRHLNLMITMLLGGLWHGANWTFVVWGGLHGALLVGNHAWKALPLSNHRLLHGPAARRLSIALTFVVVTIIWVPFRAETMTEAGRMLTALFPTDGTFFSSLSGMWKAQFSRVFSGQGLAEWFLARELWPPVLPPHFLAQSAKPAGLLLAIVLTATFLFPNTSRIFQRFDPVLGLRNDGKDATQGSRIDSSLAALDWRVAFVLAIMLVASVMGLSRVSPFLYFQF